MSMTIKANSGILRDDYLDDLRGKAILASFDKPVSAEIGEYVKALERAYLNWEQQRHIQSLDDIALKVEDPAP